MTTGAVWESYVVRRARCDDIAAIADLSRRVQDRLTETGSRQQFGPLDPDVVTAQVRAGTAWVLTSMPRTDAPSFDATMVRKTAGPAMMEDMVAERVRGAVFVEPVTMETLPALARWAIDADGLAIRYLHKLMVAPDHQGRALGRMLLDGVQSLTTDHEPALIVLDCWAGAVRLRRFYTRCGFALHGVFPEDDYEIAVFIWRPS